MLEKLSNLAQIFSGFTFRSQLRNDPEGDTHVIQLRDAEDFVRINPKTPSKIKGRKIPERHFLTAKDVLFLAKSQYNYAIPYHEAFPQAVASSTFLVLRVIQEKLYPPYLAWYLSQRQAQTFLKNRAAGTYIQNISKKDLGELKVPIPNFYKQQKIVDIYNLQIREAQILETFKAKRQAITEQQLLNTL